MSPRERNNNKKKEEREKCSAVQKRRRRPFVCFNPPSIFFFHRETMRSIATCYNEHAIRVSDSYCSGPSTAGKGGVFPNSILLSPSAPIEITTIYRAELPSPLTGHLTVTLKWRNSFLGQGLIIGVSSSGSDAAATSPKKLQKIKGNKQLNSGNVKIEVFWDLTAARFDNGPEPSSGFYVIIVAESEVVLILGNKETEQDQCLENNPKFAVISRTEHFVGGTSYSTKVRFSESGKTHDIGIRCSRAEEGTGAGSGLSVFVDQKRMCEVRRLRWNFRGNQTIFVDGLLVDLMWDVHDWFFVPRVGCAVFMLRRRSGLESRLWLEEKKDDDEIEKVEFSLLICAFNDS